MMIMITMTMMIRNPKDKIQITGLIHYQMQMTMIMTQKMTAQTADFIRMVTLTQKIVILDQILDRITELTILSMAALEFHWVAERKQT